MLILPVPPLIVLLIVVVIAVGVIFCSAVFILLCKLVILPFIVVTFVSVELTLLVIEFKLVSIVATLLLVLVICVCTFAIEVTPVPEFIPFKYNTCEVLEGNVDNVVIVALSFVHVFTTVFPVLTSPLNGLALFPSFSPT